MNIFRKCLRRDLGKKQYRKYIEICREELKATNLMEEQFNIEEKGIFHILYEQMQTINKEDLQIRWEHIMITLMKAFRIGKEFGKVMIFYFICCLLLIGLNLNHMVTCFSLVLMSLCFLYKVYEYVENKVCFMDVYLFMVYNSVVEKLSHMQNSSEGT